MPTDLTTKAIEESTYVLTAAFTDASGAAVVPTAATWTLTDEDGSVINSREDVAISSLASSVYIVLSGDDLALQSGESGEVKRVLTIEATYDSDRGNNLPLKDTATFVLADLAAVT